MFSELTTEGAAFLVLGWGFVFGLTIFCMMKVLKTDKNKQDKDD